MTRVATERKNPGKAKGKKHERTKVKDKSGKRGNQRKKLVKS